MTSKTLVGKFLDKTIKYNSNAINQIKFNDNKNFIFWIDRCIFERKILMYLYL